MSSILHKFLKVLLPMLVLSLSLGGCWDKDKDKESKTKLKMGTSADYPPFEFYKDGVIAGFDIDLAKAIASKLNYELEIIDMDIAGIIPALNSKQIDFAISALTITDKRKENVNMSEPYYINEVVVLYMPSKVSKSDIIDYPNRIIGVQQGSVFEDIMIEKQLKSPTLHIKSLPKIPMLVEELKIGRIDGIMLEKKVAKNIIASIGNIADFIEVEETINSLGIAFPKGSELTAKFDKVISEMNASGELGMLKEKWIDTNKEK